MKNLLKKVLKVKNQIKNKKIKNNNKNQQRYKIKKY